LSLSLSRASRPGAVVACALALVLLTALRSPAQDQVTGTAASAGGAPGDSAAAGVSGGSDDDAAAEAAGALLDDLESGGALDLDLSSVEEADDFLDELLRAAAALRAHPVDLNDADAARLLRIPGIGPSEARAIIDLRATRGRIWGLGDLVQAGILSAEEAERVRPYVDASPAPEGRGELDRATAGGAAAPAENRAQPGAEPGGRGARVRVSLRAVCRVEPDDRYAAAGWRGVPDATGTFARVRGTLLNGISFGAGVERDPGEASLADHSVFHVATEEIGEGGAEGARVRAIAGDFVVRWAQGLVRSGSRFPSASTLPIGRDASRGYDGAGETVGRRGFVVEVARGSARGTVLWSRTRLDAALDESGRATSVRSTGLHRTAGERAGAGALTETATAARVVVPLGPLEFGASAERLEFDPALAPDDPERRRYAFRGDELDLGGADVRWRRPRLRAGAEAAWTSSGGRAFVAAVSGAVGSARVRAGFGRASREFWSPSGNGIPGVSGGGNGIAGWLGIDYRLGRSWRASADVLVRSRPWRSYFEALPEASDRARFSLEADAAGIGLVTIDLSESAGDTGEEDEDGRESTVESSTTTVRLEVTTRGAAPLTLWTAKASARLDGIETGDLVAAGVRGDFTLLGGGAVSAGLATAVARKEGATIAQGEAALPGQMGLRLLSRSGTTWYIRLRAGRVLGVDCAVRAAGGPEPGTLTLGVSFEAKG
jgi:hypothetical protein